MNLVSKTKNAILLNLGKGLSVESLCRKLNITYEDLCKEAQADAGLMSQLKRWYKRYDFIIVKEKAPKTTGTKRGSKKAKENEQETPVEETPVEETETPAETVSEENAPTETPEEPVETKEETPVEQPQE